VVYPEGKEREGKGKEGSAGIERKGSRDSRNFSKQITTTANGSVAKSGIKKSAHCLEIIM